MLPRFENANGTVDGVNLTFYTPTFPYQAGSLAVFFNGQLKRADLMDGWVETSPSTGRFDLLIAPLDSDVLQVFYLDLSSPVTIETEVTPMRGVIRALGDLEGRLSEETVILGEVRAAGSLFGSVLEVTSMQGVIMDTQVVQGKLGVCA